MMSFQLWFRTAPGNCGSWTVRTVKTTSSAVTEVPSDQRALGRSVSEYVRPWGSPPSARLAVPGRRRWAAPGRAARRAGRPDHWTRRWLHRRAGSASPADRRPLRRTCRPNVASRARARHSETPERGRSPGRAAARPPLRRAARAGSSSWAYPDVDDRDHHKQDHHSDRGVKEVLFQAPFGAIASAGIAAAADRPAQPARLGRLEEDAEHNQEGEHEFDDAKKCPHR